MLILDIETIPNTADKGYTAFKQASLVSKTLKDPEKIATAKANIIKDKFAISPLTGKILCCGLMSTVSLDEAPLGDSLPHPLDAERENVPNPITLHYSIPYDDKDEKALLTTILFYMQRYMDNGHRIITYNGNRFDILFIIKRAMLLGIPQPANFPNLSSLISKYQPRHHLDLMEFVGERDPFTNQAKFVQLTEWAYKIGATTELVGDSNMIYEWFLTNETDKIKNHCLADIVKTYLLYEKVKDWSGGYEYN